MLTNLENITSEEVNGFYVGTSSTSLSSTVHDDEPQLSNVGGTIKYAINISRKTIAINI